MKPIPAALIFGGGEGGGTATSYTDLTHKPKINNVELSGNKDLSDLGLYSKTEVDDLLDDKADSTDVYTKTEVDDLLDDKADTTDIDLLTDTLNVKKWSQITKNGNFVDTSDWSQHGGSITTSDNILTFVQSGSDIQIYQSKSLVNGHKYFCSFTGKSNSDTFGLTIDKVSGSQRLALVCDDEWHTCETVFEANNDYTETNNMYFYGLGSAGSTVQLKNVFTVDLTDLYGAGNEPTAEEFRKLFPKEYYPYDTGTTVNGLINKVVELTNKASVIEKNINANWQGNGYNLVPYPYKSVSKTDNGITWTIKEDGGLEVSGTATATSYFDCTKSDFTSILPKGTYRISDNYNSDDLLCWLQFTNTSGQIYSNTTFAIDSDTPYKVCCRVKSGATIPSETVLYPMLVKVNDDGTYPTEYQRYAMGNAELSTPVKFNITDLLPDKFIIDADNSYRVGKIGVISFTAHIVEDVINEHAFSYPKVKASGMITTFARSASQWGAISSVGYLYLGPTDGTLTVRMSDNLPYVHVMATVVFE